MFFLPLLALCACSSDEDSISSTVQQPGEALQISVSAGEFSVAGLPDTRAIDNGAATTFEDGDKVGVIILDDSNQLLANNIPYIYDGSQWTFDASTANSEATGKQLCYYDSEEKNLTYIVYYPYSVSVDDVTNENDLKGKFIPKENQQSKDAYRSSDLMVWKSSPDKPLKVLTAELRHAYASVSFFPSTKCKLADGSDFSYVSSGVSDVSFTIGNDICDPYQASDGSFRCILPVSFTSGNIRCFYTFEGKTYSSTLTIASTASNTRYVSTQQIKDLGTYSLENAKVGDFYCKNERNDGYLIPGDIAFLGDGINCLGIVYWVGSEATGHDALLQGNHSECTHGLVVGLHELGGIMKWNKEYRYESIQNNWINKDGNPYKDRVDTYVQDKLCGYSNTVAMTDYNTGGGDAYPSNVRTNRDLLVLPCDAINKYADAHTVPTASSGWYFPSFYELKYMCWGQGNGEGVVGRDLLNRQIGKISSKLNATLFSSSNYWSSTEKDGDYNYDVGHYAWGVNFGRGDTYYYYKTLNTFLVRPSLAF